MAEDLRARAFAVVRLAFLAAGGDLKRLDRGAMAKELGAAGVARSTAFRWIGQAVENLRAEFEVNRPGKALGGLPPVPSMAAARLALTGPVADGLVTAMGGSGVAVVEKLMKCVAAAEQTMRHARRDDGTIRLPKTLMLASEHLRRTLETAAKLHESMVSMQKLDMLMADIFAELTAESPALAGRVVERIKATTAQHRASAAAPA